MILALKLDRRVMAVIGFGDGEFVFHHLRSVPRADHRRSANLAKYFDQLFAQLHPSVIYTLLPHPVGETTRLIHAVLDERAGQVGVAVKPLARSDITGALGLLPPRTRDELRQQVTPMWPALTDFAPAKQRALAEAAVAAVVGFMHESWPPV